MVQYPFPVLKLSQLYSPPIIVIWELHCIILYCIVAYCSVLQCIVSYCSVLQCIVVYLLGIGTGISYYKAAEESLNQAFSISENMDMTLFACGSISAYQLIILQIILKLCKILQSFIINKFSYVYVCTKRNIPPPTHFALIRPFVYSTDVKYCLYQSLHPSSVVCSYTIHIHKAQAICVAIILATEKTAKRHDQAKETACPQNKGKMHSFWYKLLYYLAV